MGTAHKHKLRARDLPAADAPVLEVLAWLANVSPDAMSSLVHTAWRAGDDLVAQARVAALRDSLALHAAAARRRVSPGPSVRAVVDDYLAAHPRSNKRQAFEWLADQRRKSPDTIRNAYFACHEHAMSDHGSRARD